MPLQAMRNGGYFALCFFIVVCLFCILYFICIFLLLLPTWRIKLMMMIIIM